MTAAKVMDVTARQPGCAGQGADAVSTYTQVKVEDAPSSLKIPLSECPDVWIRLPKNTSGPNHRRAWKIQSFLLSEICTVIFWQDYHGKGNSRKYYWNTVHGWEQGGNVFSQNREKEIFLFVYVDVMELAGKKQNIDPMWKSTCERSRIGRTNILP